MKKKLLSLLLTLVCILTFAACGTTEPVSSVSEDNSGDALPVIVTFKNGMKKLGELEVKSGEAVTGYEQFEELEGFLFQGWFETPSFLEASKKDLSKDTFTENIVLYGSFKSLNVTPDTRTWYVVGEGLSPVLYNSKWAGDIDDAAKDACTLKATGNVTNEVAVTLDLYKDDMFQIIHDWQWDGQYGFGKVTEYDASCVESGGGLSGENDKANIRVLEDGNYTITLTTDPDNSAQDTLVIVRNGDTTGEKATIVAPTVSENSYVVFKGSWVADWSENIEMTKTADYVYTYTKEMAAGTESYFMAWENGADLGIGLTSANVTDDASKALLEEAYNVKVKEDGTYTFTVDLSAMTIVISKQ